MFRLSLLLLFFTLISPALTQAQLHCGQPTGNPPPAIPYTSTDINGGFPDIPREAQQFNEGILHFLNITGSADSLRSALQASTPDGGPNSYPWVTAEVVSEDITGDKSIDVLVNITVHEPTPYAGFLNLYSCTENGYELLSSIVNTDAQDLLLPTARTINYVMDINSNQRPDIILTALAESQDYSRSVHVYEWNGKTLAQTFGRGPDTSILSMILKNRDSTSDTLDMIVERNVAYPSVDISAGGSSSLTNNLNEVYRWDGTQYALICQYFPEGGLLFETLQAAETYRACGDFSGALDRYEFIWSNMYPAFWYSSDWSEGVNTSRIVAPASVSNKAAYLNGLELDYLRAFAAYRIVQIKIAQGHLDQAQDWVNRVQRYFLPHTNSYAYAAMTAAFWDTYQQNHNTGDACTAAGQRYRSAFDSGDDPGIPYNENEAISATTHGFYFTRGLNAIYSSDPDNLFEVPPELSGLLTIPMCL